MDVVSQDSLSGTYGPKPSGPAITGNAVASVMATVIARASRIFRLLLMGHLLLL